MYQIFRAFDIINTSPLLKYTNYSFYSYKIRVIYNFFLKDPCGENKNIKREDEGERRHEAERKRDTWTQCLGAQTEFESN